MSTVIRISDDLAKDAKIRSNVERRSVTAQVEYWAVIGKAVEENPDLPYSFIKETLLGLEEMKAKGKEDYAFG
ncbi:MAG: ParD-like family protein [Opitutales bacterium]|nr:ParD-like family protein [Opitutales bacterium]